MVLNEEDRDSSPRQSRLDAELQEILARADRPPTASEQARASVREVVFTLKSRPAPAWTAKLAPLAPLALALLLALLGAMSRSFSPVLATLLGIGAAISLVRLWLPSGPSGKSGPRWRGQDLSDPPAQKRWPR